MNAGSVIVVLLQKSHHLSPMRPFAHEGQMIAGSTPDENALQKLQW
jgi:hypothetical protein